MKSLPERADGHKSKNDEGYLSLSKEQRYYAILAAAFENPQHFTIQEIADQIGCSAKTLYADFNDPRFTAFRERVLPSFVGNTVLLHAWRNISNAICRNKDVKLSQWLIEWTQRSIQVGTLPIEGEIVEDTIDVLENMNGETDKAMELMNKLRRRFDAEDTE